MKKYLCAFVIDNTIGGVISHFTGSMFVTSDNDRLTMKDIKSFENQIEDLAIGDKYSIFITNLIEVFEEDTSEEIKTDSTCEDGDLSINNQLVFKCNKCGHLLFVDTINLEHLKSIAKSDCPKCGEEGNELWKLVRTGNYEREYGEEDE